MSYRIMNMTEENKQIMDEAVDQAASILIDAMKKCDIREIACNVTDEDKTKYRLKIEKVDPLV